MIKSLSILALLLATPCFAASVYVAQSSAGGNTGADCADARALSTLAAGDWVAGSTIHLCGTITVTAGTSGLVAQGSGTSGSPITVKFETNAVLQSPYFGGSDLCNSLDACPAAIKLYDNYIIVDGGTNGIIQNTANGSDLANHQSSAGIGIYGSNIIVRNLTIQNIYLNDPAAEETAGADTVGVVIVQGSTNIAICNNTMNYAHAEISSRGVGSSTPVYPLPSCSLNTFPSGLNFFGNTLNQMVWGMVIGGTTASTANIFSNNINIGTAWVLTNDYYHTDGIIAFGAPMVTIYAYNNYFWGPFNGTAQVFCDDAGAGTGCSAYIFNNLFVNATTSPASGQPIWLAMTTGTNDGPSYVYNNTIVNFGNELMIYGDSSVTTLENNLTVAGTTGTYFYMKGYGSNSLPSALTASDYNSFYGGRSYGPFNGPGVSYSWPPSVTSPTWVSTGFDTHSISANPNLSSSYLLTSGSPAIGAATNLTSLCSTIAPLCYDAAGNARPSSGAWDIGAYNYLTGVNAGGSFFGFGE